MDELIVSLQITDIELLNALIVLGVFLAIAFLVDLFIRHVLIRLAALTKSDDDDRIVNATRRPAFITIFLFGLTNSAQIYEFSKDAFLIIDRVSYSLIALFWSFAIFQISNIIINNAIQRLFNVAELKKGIIPLTANIVKVIIIVLTLLSILVIWNIDLTPLIASAGIASVILALAAKDTVGNLLGGISVFLDKPYQLGDYINLHTGERGEVIDIGMRSTRIKTRDDLLINIPNAIISNSMIINESQPVPQFRCRVPIGVAYGSDIDLVEEILMKIAYSQEYVIDNPEPRVRFREFGDSALNYELLCWVTEPVWRGLTIHEINRKIYKEFAEKGIKIPFPQRELYLNKGESE